MKSIALTIAVTCLVGVGGCVAPTHTYDQIHSRNWTRESIDKRFPDGTTQKSMLDQLGGPYASKSSGDLTRWDYVGGPTGQQHVIMIFRNGQLIDKRYENF